MMLATKPAKQTFYIAGGTLRRDAECYVARLADAQLYEALQQGQFCYVLTARQMGKSSLMVRTATRLRETGAGVAVLDLTAIGQNVSAEQWYGGLLSQLAQQLDLEDELLAFWQAQMQLGPLQRWLQALRQVVLPCYTGPVVLFIDEIDAVLSLPFSTDEFFAGIRELYNFRTEDSELERLTFCLLGVASPADLIRDTRTTPFNIGQRIELRDFTEAEAHPLAAGLQRGEPLASELLRRILFWSNGHPYLTQRLCKAVAEDVTIHNALGVDVRCAELFFGKRAAEQDDNLLFVRERLLKSEVDVAGLLSLYARVLNGPRVEDEAANPLVTVLRLSGVARVENGGLVPRNPIYAQVFSREWVTKNMPDAEVQRQRAAYRRGLLRASAIAAVIIAVIAALAVYAWQQRNLALEKDRVNQRLLYVSDINLAQQSRERFSNARIQELLRRHIPPPGQPDWRGFEWFHLWRLTHSELQSWDAPERPRGLALSPDGRWLISGGTDKKVIRRDLSQAGAPVLLAERAAVITTLNFSPDGQRLAVCDTAGEIKLWETGAWRELPSLKTAAHETLAVWLPNGKAGRRLATGNADGEVCVWDAESGQPLTRFAAHQGEAIVALAASPDGQWLATSADALKIWHAATGRAAATLPVSERVLSLAFSPDGRWLIAPDLPGVRVWATGNWRETATLKGHAGGVLSMAFSADSRFLATAGLDRNIKFWQTATWQELGVRRGHDHRITELAFLPDGMRLLSAGLDSVIKLWNVATELRQPRLLAAGETLMRQHTATREVLPAASFTPDAGRIAAVVGGFDQRGYYQPSDEVRVWDTATAQETLKLKNGGQPFRAAVFAPDGRRLATSSDDHSVRLWDAASGAELSRLPSPSDLIFALAFSPDGKRLAAGGDAQTVNVWDSASGRALATLRGHNQWIAQVLFTPDGQRLLTADAARVVKLWDLATGRAVLTLNLPPDATWALACSPDGRWLFVPYGDGGLKAFELTAGREVLSFTAHAGRLLALAFSPDGKRLASSSTDQTVKLWDWTTGQEVAAFRSGDESMLGLAFAADGKQLAGLGVRSTVRRWVAADAKEVAAQVR